MSTLKDFLLVSDVLNYIDTFLGLLGNTELGQQVSPSCTCVFLKIFLCRMSTFAYLRNKQIDFWGH